MSGLPPLPPGATLVPAPRDPLEVLKAEGFQFTNGYRTDQDVERIRAQGYKPAKDGAHNRGDGVDLIHAKLSPKQQAIRLQQLAREHGWNSAVILDEGHHRHLAIPGWGKAPGTPGTPNSGLPPLPLGAKLYQRGSLSSTPAKEGGSLPALRPTGQAVDGDTFKLRNGQNARLFGVDAWELPQKGRLPAGSLLPIGIHARDYLSGRISPDMPINAMGPTSYGRRVVSIGNDSDDPARGLLRNGHGLAAMDYLRGTPQFSPYMEAERLARANRLGGHETNAETPEEFRRKDGPWQGAEPGKWGEGQAVFNDEPMPFMGLRPEIEQGFLAIWNDPKSKPEDLLAYAQTNGFTLSAKEVRQKYAKRFKNGDQPDSEASYAAPPKLLTDTGHGAAGSFGRGFIDPVNMVDEVGGVLQTVGLPSRNGERENIWNSDRRFGDILWNNIDQNRSILGHDQEHHPVARFGGQLTSAVVLPYGVGARSVGAITRTGAIEGGLAGFGAGEGGVVDRLPGAVAGAAMGAAGGHVLGRVADDFRNLHQYGPREAILGPSRLSGGNDGLNAGPTPRSTPQGISVAAMRADNDTPTLVGPEVRQRDVIDVSGLPPLPEGAELLPPLMAGTRRMVERATAEQMAAMAGRIEPQDVTAIPDNRIASLEEAAQANPGTIRDLDAPDEYGTLTTRKLPSRGVRPTYHKGPLDLVAFIRAEGGLQDQGGNLRHLGMGNAARRLDFSGNEQFLGRLVNDESGMTLDDAAHRAWEEGYFPELQGRPTIDEFMDALHGTYTGNARRFHPNDLDEVDEFYSARSERARVEQAADEGSPLADRIGEPVTLDDLNANEPPAIAYEDLPSIGGKAGNIDLSRLETKEDIGRALQQTEKLFGGFDAARRGRISHAETAALADELGMRVDDLLKRRQGQALNAEEALAARRILARSGDELVKLAERAKGGSEDDLLAFRRGMLRHAAIQEQVTGMTAEAGRALSQFKALADSKAHRERVMKAILETAGGRENLEQAADAILELQKVPGALNKFAADAVKPTWKDKLVELWYNSLLSGPRTHAVNILSNSLTSALQIPEHAAAAVVGQVRRGATDRVLMSELGPRVVGLLQGAQEGLRAFKYTLRTGKVPDHVSKVEAAQQEAISGLKGKILRTPTRLLSAEDEFFKAVARRSELAALAVRKARGESLKGEALTKRIEELTANPSGEMMEQALDYARYLTFQRPLGEFGQDVMRWTSRSPILKLFLPFVRTPTNLVKFALERSPAAPLLREVRADFKAGGARRDLAVARMSLGSGLGMLVTQWASDGMITGGGPADANRERLLRADGWQPYSIKVGDQYVSYQRLDPLAMTLGVAADFVDLQSAMTDKQREDVAALIAASMIQNLANKTWMSGASDLAEAVGDPQRYGDAFMRRLAGSIAVPAASSQLAQTVDPNVREARSILDAVKARIPFASKSLLPQRNVWGEEIVREGGLGPDVVSPLPLSTRRNDPVTREAIAVGAKANKPQRGKMSDAQFNEFLRVSGEMFKRSMREWIASPEWKQMTPQEREDAFNQEKRAARKAAKEALGVSDDEDELPPLPPGAAIVK